VVDRDLTTSYKGHVQMTLTRQLRVELILETIIYLDPFVSSPKEMHYKEIHTDIEQKNSSAFK